MEWYWWLFTVIAGIYFTGVLGNLVWWCKVAGRGYVLDRYLFLEFLHASLYWPFDWIDAAYERHIEGR